MHLLGVPLDELSIVVTLYNNTLGIEYMVNRSEALSESDLRAVERYPFLGFVEGAMM